MTSHIENLISTVGFPISAFLLMFWHNVRTVNKLSEHVHSNTEVLRELKVFIKNKNGGG